MDKVRDHYYIVFSLLVSNLAVLLSLIFMLNDVVRTFEILIYLVFLAISFYLLFLSKDADDFENQVFALIFFVFSFSNSIYMYLELKGVLSLILVLINVAGILYFAYPKRQEDIIEKPMVKDYVPRKNYFEDKFDAKVEELDKPLPEVKAAKIHHPKKEAKHHAKKEAQKTDIRNEGEDSIIIEEIKAVDVEAEKQALKELKKKLKKNR